MSRRDDDYRDEQPDDRPRGLWRRANVYEKAALILAALGAIFITWLATRGVP